MALSLDVAAWNRTPGIDRLLVTLGAHEGLTRYVGGAVRDHLLGLPTSDIDLATRLRPGEVIQRLEDANIKAVPTGIDHGTVTAVSDGYPFEITTLRRDVETDGRRATVAFTDDWKEDAARRDFTMNALFADPVTGELFDYFGGIRDLHERRVRFIGDAFARIAEDHLRILRFFRFHARFDGGEPDASALAACTARANDLMALSRERIADEFLKLLALPDPAPTVQIMLECSILRPVLPEIGPDGIGRLKALVESERRAAITPSALRRLSALLPADVTVVQAVAARLRLSNSARKRLACAAVPLPALEPKMLAYRLGVECATDRLLLAGAAIEAASIASWNPPRLPIGGGVLIARGVPQGPLVARTLRLIEDRWVEAGFPTGPELDLIVERAVDATV